MQIKLNKIPFDVRPVPGQVRAALYRDPAMRAHAARAVWRWDAAAAMAVRRGRDRHP